LVFAAITQGALETRKGKVMATFQGRLDADFIDLVIVPGNRSNANCNETIAETDAFASREAAQLLLNNPRGANPGAPRSAGAVRLQTEASRRDLKPESVCHR
jgi:hypothetical protein